MNSLIQINIPKRNHYCHNQGERLLPGMEIFSLIVEGNNELQRQDFCSSCWNELQIRSQKIDIRSYWKSRIEPSKSPLPSTRNSKALNLLLALYHCSEPADEEIFILCLFLARARQIALRQEFQYEKATYHLYEILHREEFLKVKVVNISPHQIKTIQGSLAVKLQSEKI